MGNLIEIIPGTAEWHEYRSSRIGASDSSAILGISPFKTPRKLYEEKILGKNGIDNFSMKRGRERESEAIKWAEQELGVLLGSRIIQHDEHPWKFATLDGICPEHKTVVEVKWANKQVHELAKQGTIVDYYYSQVQSQIACVGVDKAYFLSCYQEKECDPEFILITCDRDQPYIDDMILKEKEWYINHIVRMEEPNLGDKDHVKVDVDGFDEACKDYINLCSQIADLEKKKKDIHSFIQTICDDSSSQSTLFKATKFKVQGSVDYKSIKELEGVNLDLYRKEDRYQWKISGIKE